MAEHWNNLPMDLVMAIVQRLAFMDDFINFSGVCKSWKSATISLKIKKPLMALPPKFPWLILAEEETSSDDEKNEYDHHETPARGFFNLSTAKTHGLELSEASGRLILGANYGWLVTLGKDLQINLLHPFLRHQISLPPMLTFPNQYDYTGKYKPEDYFDMFVEKFALSSTPSNDNKLCTIMAIYGELSILALAKLGDKFWTNVQAPSRSFHDVVYHEGKFYAVDCHGVIFVCDIDDDDDDKLGPRATQIAPPPVGDRDYFQKYLVESSGDLLLVSRMFRYAEDDIPDQKLLEYYYATVDFSVWKLEDQSGVVEGSNYPCSLVQVNSLGNKAVFIGGNSSVSLCALDCVKPNCIYFTDDQYDFFYRKKPGGGHDMGIFNMEHRTIEPHYQGKSLHPFSPPLWYI